MSKKFFSKVYNLVSKIPQGKVATYGQIAAMLGEPKSARIVGWAMRSAPDNLHLPCHRVVNKSGGLSPDYVFGSSEFQRFLLESEGIIFRNDGRIDMEKCLWDGKS
ncbi:MGMT family protein [Clostridium luticellarii]|uniref:Methylated-DNA--protein-cysteine methyltransferase, constitutive n=1 Tax=Clostridium luticellarii TaxID=1691940 RepID=A0A2T0BMK7_9CLOT|nr:MGMT family protein [Clostridium luticellarii]MCI1945235.1 MGMT family protein [Clostridium luticellarii]MCI1969649.1 MGMT family protein [Clostridium luticellarii]MCI1994568.1 MGMT family protein [Clostridium luticellarii]MCI2038935.1 MGMT family protein [Clostridium luticellarii]PRR85114.1 Methylated-DNA--protein-cysteine methyltransferase, constitutive [Clostridium luticellarii]